MRKEEKQQVVQSFSEKLTRAKAVILAEYRGLKVSEITNLKREVKKMDGNLNVIKNRLAKIALKDSALKGLEPFFKGPTAVAYSGTDPVLLAKVLAKFTKDFEAFKLKAGFIGGKVISGADVLKLSTLPSREELYAKLLGTLVAPAGNFVRVLNALPTKVVVALKEIQKVRETKGGEKNG